MLGVAYGWFAEGVKITATLRLRALLDIYSDHRKRRHCALSPRALELAWRGTGMRRDDLKLALQDAVGRQLLAKTSHEDYELTYVGEVTMQSSVQDSPLERMAEWALLRRLRLRRYQSEIVNQRLARRHSDDLKHI